MCQNRCQPSGSCETVYGVSKMAFGVGKSVFHLLGFNYCGKWTEKWIWESSKLSKTVSYICTQLEEGHNIQHLLGYSRSTHKSMGEWMKMTSTIGISLWKNYHWKKQLQSDWKLSFGPDRQKHLKATRQSVNPVKRKQFSIS